MSSTVNTQASRTSLASHDRKLRYREILEDLSSLEENADNNVERMEKTASAVREARNLLADGDLSERVTHPGECYLDSRVLRATSDLAVRCSHAVSGNVNTYDRRELAHHIRENPEYWDLVFPSEVPAIGYLFGTFAPTPPEHRPRAPRRRVERQQAAALQSPAAVDSLEKTEEGSEMVSLVRRFITKTYKNGGEKPISYFELVLDPASFGRTIENIYHVSFLVRDGMVSVEIDEASGLPLIRPVASAQTQQQRDISDENQFIVSVDMQRWRELVDVFDIRQPMMVLKGR